MGVPTFYRWLCNRYPRVPKDTIDNYKETSIDMSNIETIGVDLLSPNPNGEFDNLYLDMNGIIHPCCHPENMEQPESEEVMFECIFDYIDRIFYIVRPRKIMFLAIDGVAPRAKINQQRSRRFKSAADADLEDEVYNKLVEEFGKKKGDIPIRKDKWDSNVITPGTPFMHELSKRIVDYIQDRIEKYDAWKRITVIFSDSGVPGEGEHKIMKFIRNQRHAPNYDPNTKHVLHGMDADLIMLGLATHEVNFFILREIVTNFINFKPEDNVANQIEQAKSVVPKEKPTSSHQQYISLMRQSWKPMQFLQLPVLREYLSYQLHFPNGWRDREGVIDFERCVDDLVLMCFFCGNDFLPHLPSISITGGSIDQMILLYQKILPDLGDYLSNEGDLNMPQVGSFVSYLSKIENQVFKQAQEHKERYKRKMQQNGNSEIAQFGNVNKNRKLDDGSASVEPKEEGYTEAEFKRRQEEILKQERTVEDPKEPIDLSLNDPKLWKEAYYREKFNLGPNDDVTSLVNNVVFHYVEGLAWVLKYYYQGCVSWGWFYPFHYAPFCSDLKFEGLDIKFELGKPFTAFQQLMSVMPIRSSHCLPKEFRELMTDSNSPLADFYPLKFKEDPNGKRYKYQWVALLPFIDEKRLLNIVEPIEKSLSKVDKDRNAISKDLIFMDNREKSKTLIGNIEDNGDRSYFTSICDKKHKSHLLKGAILPQKRLRVEDVMEDQRNRGFNCEIAKRMILNVLDIKQDEFNSGVLRDTARDYHQYHNQYHAHQTLHHPGKYFNVSQQGGYQGQLQIPQRTVPPWHTMPKAPQPHPSNYYQVHYNGPRDKRPRTGFN
ncbi:5'-_3' exoribonuclease, putative [Theileria equi strain WA]|uniref:5'-3' exoribonuclease n=1 Tax=Theileria equi strain WA TaxID=1537102 RepID=L0B236_THEEQ|nr:5'->3' exoribonuclease, putative [Theileria equi strain WA]AFZ81199.1 5'->3' exoribonuclease, putative [Theileria equi strain WA]|eukprot:XP_004830865.1 5'-_3' exoribonuclease, putative [Theileria equi strain WA]